MTFTIQSQNELKKVHSGNRRVFLRGSFSFTCVFFRIFTFAISFSSPIYSPTQYILRASILVTIVLVYYLLQLKKYKYFIIEESKH